ncbi:MAG: SURF1 family protein [Anaerolineae bacterium]|nr:SURF1 family protein [Anaerolineae bacterium]
MKNLLTWKWLLRHLLVLAAIIVLINLGFWQLRRLEQRRALNANILAGLNAPVTLLAGQDVDPAALHLHRVSATGTFDNDESLVIRNRPFQGMPGVWLIAPLQLAGSNRAVLVDRGWIPLDNATPAKRQIYNQEGTVTIEGIAYQTQTRPDRWLIPTDPTPGPGETRLDEWFRVDIERIHQQQLPYPLLPIFIKQLPNGDVASTTPPLREGEPELSEGSHLSYALQWFGFAVILALVYGLLLRQELKKKIA